MRVGMRRWCLFALLFTLGPASCARAQVAPCLPSSGADWMVTAFAADPGTSAARAADCEQAQQNPPSFSWPYVSGAAYTLSLTFPDGHVETRATDRNWLNWGAALPPGDYRWSVAQSGLASRARRFSLDASAVAFVVPDVSDRKSVV